MNLQKIKRWAPLLVIIALMAVFWFSGASSEFTLESLQNRKEDFLSFTDAHPLLSLLIFAVLYILCVTLSLPIATLMTLLGGFLFGKWIGTLIVVTSATIGATIIFLIAKTSLGSALRRKAGKLYQRIDENMRDNATGYLLFMRLVPLFPFFLVNIVPALFNVPVRVYVLTTFFGIMPGSFVYVNVGETLGDIEKLGDLVSTETLVAFGLLGLFSLLPSLFKQYKKHRQSQTGDES